MTLAVAEALGNAKTKPNLGMTLAVAEALSNANKSKPHCDLLPFRLY